MIVFMNLKNWKKSNSKLINYSSWNVLPLKEDTESAFFDIRDLLMLLAAVFCCETTNSDLGLPLLFPTVFALSDILLEYNDNRCAKIIYVNFFMSVFRNERVES